MLTQKQLEELKSLTTNHPKYGKILKDAIKIWNLEDVSPEQGR